MEKENNKKIMLHLYHGDGKGKTTCAMGLALRYAHYGKKVLIVQFLKNGASGEVLALQTLENVTVKTKSITNTFSWLMTPEEKSQTKEAHHALLDEATETEWDLLVLDELCAALSTHMMDIERVKEFLREVEGEIVITGRNPPDFLREIADYSTCMTLEKHPFTQGIPAREGVEF